VHLELESDAWCKSVYHEFRARTADVVDEFYEAVRGVPSAELEPWILEETYRVLVQLHATVSSLFDRASASNDQSTRD
jgi:hypothetical protein